MLKLAIRNLLRQRMRAGLTLAAIALGVASIILSGGFVADILLQLREATIRSQLGHLQIYRQGQFASGGRDPFEFMIERTEPVDRAIETLPDVVVRARRLGFSGLLSNGRGELPIRAEGIEPQAEAVVGSAITLRSGRQLAERDPFGILVGEGLAHALKLAVDDTVNLVTSTRDGALNALEFKVVGVFRSLSKEYDASAVRLPLRAAQELTGTVGVNAIVVLLADTDRTEQARAELAARLPPGLEIKTWNELAEFYNNTSALYRRQFAVLQAIILVMVLLSVANSVNMTLHERTAEFGIMRALGRTGRDVFRLAVLETALLGLAGAALGILGGIAVAAAISAVGIPMPPPPNSESGFTAAIRIVPAMLLGAFGLGVVGAIGASLLPARHLARMPVVDALRRGL